MDVRRQNLHPEHAQPSSAPDLRAWGTIARRHRRPKTEESGQIDVEAAFASITITEPNSPGSNGTRDGGDESTVALEALDDQEGRAYWQQRDAEYFFLDAIEALDIGVEFAVEDSEQNVDLTFENNDERNDPEDDDASIISCQPQEYDFNVMFDLSFAYGDKGRPLSRDPAGESERSMKSNSQDSS